MLKGRELIQFGVSFRIPIQFRFTMIYSQNEAAGNDSFFKPEVLGLWTPNAAVTISRYVNPSVLVALMDAAASQGVAANVAWAPKKDRKVSILSTILYNNWFSAVLSIFRACYWHVFFFHFFLPLPFGLNFSVQSWDRWVLGIKAHPNGPCNDCWTDLMIFIN